jgi:hypothetical protein
MTDSRAASYVEALTGRRLRRQAAVHGARRPRSVVTVADRAEVEPHLARRASTAIRR